MYSVGAGKFVGFNTSDVKTYLKDAPTTADRVTLTASGSNFVLADATGRKVNISTWQAYLGVKVFDCDADGGNLLVVTAVNTSADFSAALALIDELEAPDPEPEPIEDYYVCFDKAATHNTWGGTKTDRDVAKVSLNSPTFGLQEINTTNAHNVYNDMTSAEGFKVAPGETVVPAIGYTGSWMHGYVYVDLDQSKQFEVESIDAAELVTYNYYNGVNKAGASASVNVAFGTPFPAFTAPSEPGTYRIRFKVDWESYEPAGAAGANGDGTGHQGIVTNGGTIVDALMIVAEPPTVKHTVTFTYKQNGAVIGTTSQEVFEGDPVPAISVPGYVEATPEGTMPETVTEDLNIVVNTTVKADCPFKMYASTEAEDVVWTALTLKRTPALYLYATEDGTQISNTAVETLPTDETLKKYAWCLVGDWLNGFTINNLATGKRIASPSTALTDGSSYHAILTDAALEDGTDKFKLVTNSAGNYFIKRADTDNYFLSNFGGVGNTLLSFWNSGSALTDGGAGDGGSIFEVVAITLPEPAPQPTLYPTSVTPANEATVESLETVVVTFPQAVTYDDTKVITINSRTGYSETASVTVSTEDPTQVTIAAPAAITERGMYAASIPEGAFTAIADGSYNPAATFLYYVQPAANSYVYVTANPADGSTVTTGLEKVTLTYAEADGPGFADSTPINVHHVEGDSVITTATLALSSENYTDVVLTLSEKITTNGTYTITVPEGYIYNALYDGEAEDKGVSMGATYNPEFTLSFNVDFKLTLVPTVAPTTTTETLETITLTFDKEVTYDNSKTITLGNRMMGESKDITVAVSAEDAHVVTITLAEPVTEPGFLSLYIPEATFTATEDDTFNPELTSSITVLAPTNSFAFESTTPADNANLLELSTVKVTYADVPTLATEGASVNVINTETSTAVTTATVAYDAEDWNSVVFTLADAITTPGTYTLTIPDEFIWNSQYNESAEDKGVSQGATYTPATTLTFNVIEAYPVNFDKNMNRTRTDRRLNSVTLTEEGQEGQTVTPANTWKIYNDQHETAVLTCTVGSTLTATFNYSGTWMHGYVYIDTENDYAFSFNEGSTDQSGTDLKTFAFYSGSFTNDASGRNSNGDYISGDARANINPPSFTAPTTPGTYRIRFKVDWNSVDPGGQKAADGTVTGSNGIAANGGYILDATLVVNPLAPIAPTSVTPADQAIVESFTAATITFEGDVNYNSEKEITIGQRGGMYYETATVTVEGNTVTVTAPAEITEPGYYTITVPEGAFSTEGRINEAFSTSFVILAPANTFEYTSVSPEDESTQQSLHVITLSYAPEWIGWVDATPIDVLDAESNAVGTATLSMSETDNTDALLTLSAALTANGTYTITVPEGYIYNNNYDGEAEDKGVSMGATYNPAFTLTFTVSQNTGIGSVSIDRNAGKTIFSIDGRKVSGKLQRGAYIIDGQKKFVK